MKQNIKTTGAAVILFGAVMLAAGLMSSPEPGMLVSDGFASTIRGGCGIKNPWQCNSGGCAGEAVTENCTANQGLEVKGDSNLCNGKSACTGCWAEQHQCGT